MNNLKKVVILSSYSFYDGKATANRIKTFAQELEKKDFIKSINIIATNEHNNAKSKYSQKIKVQNIKIKKYNRNKIFIRIANEIIIAFKLWKFALKSSPNIIIITIPSIMLLLPLIIRINKPDIIIDVRDIIWNYLPNNFLMRVIRKTTEIIFNMASKKSSFITTTNLCESKLIKSITSKKVIVVQNGISITKIDKLSKIPFSKLNDKITLMYVGNVGVAQELDSLINFAKLNEHIAIIIIGEGAKLDHLKKLSMNNNIKNISFFEPVQFDELLKFYSKSDILFAQIGPNYSSAIPTKIFEYIASGKRVLLGLPEGIAKNIFSHFYGVEVFETGNIEKMNLSLKILLNNNFSQAEKLNNINNLKNNYLRENHVNLLIKSIEKIGEI